MSFLVDLYRKTLDVIYYYVYNINSEYLNNLEKSITSNQLVIILIDDYDDNVVRLVDELRKRIPNKISVVCEQPFNLGKLFIFRDITNVDFKYTMDAAMSNECDTIFYIRITRQLFNRFNRDIYLDMYKNRITGYQILDY